MAAPVIESLTVILGYTQLALAALAPDSPVRPYVQQAEEATHQAIHDLCARRDANPCFARLLAAPLPSPPPEAAPLMP
jgi:hypothetical protein